MYHRTTFVLLKCSFLKIELAFNLLSPLVDWHWHLWIYISILEFQGWRKFLFPVKKQQWKCVFVLLVWRVMQLMWFKMTIFYAKLYCFCEDVSRLLQRVWLKLTSLHLPDNFMTAYEQYRWHVVFFPVIFQLLYIEIFSIFYMYSYGRRFVSVGLEGFTSLFFFNPSKSTLVFWTYTINLRVFTLLW